MLFMNVIVLFVLGVQVFKFVLIGEEGVIQVWDVGRVEQGNIVVFQQMGVYQFVDLYFVVYVMNVVGVGIMVVFQYQQVFYFQMLYWVEEGCCVVVYVVL